MQNTANELASVEAHRDRSWWALIGVSVMFVGLGVYAGVLQEFSLAVVLGTAGILAVGMLSWWRHEIGEQRRARIR